MSSALPAPQAIQRRKKGLRESKYVAMWYQLERCVVVLNEKDVMNMNMISERSDRSEVRSLGMQKMSPLDNSV
jgi:hypothetical protein